MAMATQAGGGGRRQHKFFKVLMPGSFEMSLRIPPKFAAGLACGAAAAATLRDPAGRTWDVVLDHRTCFSGRGWLGFVSGNGLSAGQMLVFEHRGGLDFAVDVFDPSGCLGEVAAEEVSTAITGDMESGNGRRRAEAEADAPCTGAKRRRKKQPPPSSSTEKEDDETLRIEWPYQLRLLDVSKSLCERLGWTTSRTVELCCAAAGGGERRKRWPVSVKVSAKSGMLCAGWAEFAHDNGLALSDACVFLPSSHAAHVCQVHLLRAAMTQYSQQ